MIELLRCNHPRTVLDYAREKCFDPLGISTQPSFSQALPGSVPHHRIRYGRLLLGHRPRRDPARPIRYAAHCAGHDEDRGNSTGATESGTVNRSCRPTESTSAPRRRIRNKMAAHPTTSTACSGGSSGRPNKLDTMQLGSAGNASSCPQIASNDHLHVRCATGLGLAASSGVWDGRILTMYEST